MRLAIITAIDLFDSYVLRHCLHGRGLCAWIADHPWWGNEEER